MESASSVAASGGFESPSLRRDGRVQGVASLLDQKQREHIRHLDDDYFSHAQWLRCMLLLAKKRMMEEETAEKPARQSPKKPRRSVMEAAARAQVKQKVNFFNQLSGNSPSTAPSASPAKQTPSSTATRAPSVVTILPSLTPTIAEASAPPPPPPQEPAATDYTSVFGRLNLGGTPAEHLSTINSPTRPAATAHEAEALPPPPPTQILVSGPAASDPSSPAHQLQQQEEPACDGQQLTHGMQQLTLREVDEEEEEDSGEKEQEEGTAMEVVPTSGSAPPEASGQLQDQHQPCGRESVEEVLCDFRTGFIKKPLIASTKPTDPPACTAHPPPEHTAATDSIEHSKPVAVELEGPEPIIECNQKKPAVVVPAAPRHPVAGEHHHCQVGGDSPKGGGGGAAHFFKSIGLGKIASAFKPQQQPQQVDGLAMALAKVAAQPPIEGFDTVQESYAMSDSDSQEERDDFSDDDDDEDELGGSQQKKIPAWARGQALAAALERQFNVSASTWVDPDTIFPEVTTCNLEEIFKVRKKRYYKRTSSGNWGADAIKPCEKLAYKRQLAGGGRTQY